MAIMIAAISTAANWHIYYNSLTGFTIEIDEVEAYTERYTRWDGDGATENFEHISSLKSIFPQQPQELHTVTH